eukprot:CAMPEP_0195299058 /NCGR_PEP_ID=MMETSP0707-20130614/24774_1 /TAXON_ID=33640 /ORGANISM="Asterionellopsis glacialis, Strain CCMP134" /LENGTH=501 /DNA_ID=CAMNT_0040361329 /DNA_START=283 /DNA_END=1788 /DNA_ORIENTATION=+
MSEIKKKSKKKFKKAPQAPKRFKSSYMFFSTHKHQEIRKQINDSQSPALKTTAVAKMVSEAWKNLSEKDRQKWEDIAKKDKDRYRAEKERYTGPWKVPVTRKMKDPDAPRRPMSAFLAYSHSKRRQVKEMNPGAMSTEISRILATNWKNASEQERKPFVDHEYDLRMKYKVATKAWKAERKAEEERFAREEEEEDYDPTTDDAMYHKKAYNYQTSGTTGGHGYQGDESSLTPLQHQGHVDSSCHHHYHGGWTSSQTAGAPPRMSWHAGASSDQNTTQYEHENTHQSQFMNGHNATNAHNQYSAEEGMHPSNYHHHAPTSEGAPPPMNWHTGDTSDQNTTQQVYENANQHQFMTGYYTTNDHHHYSAEGGMHPSNYHDHAPNRVYSASQTTPHSNQNTYSRYGYYHQAPYHTPPEGAMLEGDSLHYQQERKEYYSNSSMPTDHARQKHHPSGSSQHNGPEEQGLVTDYTPRGNHGDENNFTSYDEGYELQRSDYKSDDLHQN